MYGLIDTHAHLEEIKGLELTLAEAKAANVIGIIAVGSDFQSNQRVLELARTHEGFIYPALGLHPWNLRAGNLDQDLEFIDTHIAEAVAMGEVGLDYHKKVREGADKDLQKQALKAVLGIARRHQKPAIIHSRYAWRDAFDLVKESGLERVVFHWYTGTSSVLRDIIAQGYFISANPAIEYHEEHRRAVKEAPLAQLLLETDSPVVYGRGRGLEYESRPADVRRVLAGVAALKAVSEPQVAEATTENVMRLFRMETA